MKNKLLSLAAAALISGGASLSATQVSAAPIANGAALKNSVSTQTENVYCRGCGWGVAAGVLGGAIIGGAIANSYRYGPGPYYYDGPYGPPPYAPAYGPGPAPGYYAGGGGDAVAYCMSRYKSYDPRSGTFLGYDGYRHPCP